MRETAWEMATLDRDLDVDQVGAYVDILGCLGSAFDDLTDTVEQYLRLALTRDLPDADIIMTNNTIDELRR